ncbi:unnamed protein product [Moneuplotes crassus]|uniref:Uncharacterized protein n=1 Tax=Euplotes crassus TaxID=5936 RepID=A0AAD2D2J5_EUPCR|nr:unnamed protein product [Moneuplotes crassus]
MKFCDLSQLPLKQAFIDKTMDKDAFADFLHLKTKVTQNISKCLEQASSKRIANSRRKHGYFQKHFLERQREKWERKKLTSKKNKIFVKSHAQHLSPFSSRPNEKFLLNLPMAMPKTRHREGDGLSPIGDRRFYSRVRSTKYSQQKEFYLNSFLHYNPEPIQKERKTVTRKKDLRLHHPSMENTFIGRSLKSEGKIPKFFSAKNSVATVLKVNHLRRPKRSHQVL